MPVVNLDELNPAAKFYFDETSWVMVRALSTDAALDIRKECLTVLPDEYKQDKQGRFQRIPGVEKFDNDKMRKMTWDYTITAWGGFLDADGKEIPCNYDTKVKFMAEWPKFGEFVDKSYEAVTASTVEAVKESEKN